MIIDLLRVFACLWHMATGKPRQFRKTRKVEPAVRASSGVRIGRILDAMDRNLSKIKAEPE
jgi:hypothetical protein